MCSLCGVLGGQSHWVDPATSPAVFSKRDDLRTFHRERQDQTRLVNQVLSHYRLSASQWTGRNFIVKSPTGRSEIAENLSQVWAAAEKLRGSACDPLDDDLIAGMIDDPGGLRR